MLPTLGPVRLDLTLLVPFLFSEVTLEEGQSSELQIETKLSSSRQFWGGH